MLTDFRVRAEIDNRGWGGYYVNSKVYAIDSQRDRFLITDDRGNFVWVDTGDCVICEGDCQRSKELEGI